MVGGVAAAVRDDPRHRAASAGLGQVSHRRGTPARGRGRGRRRDGADRRWSASSSSRAHAVDTFSWSGTIGTLILLVAYVLTTIGAIRLIFVQRRMPVPMWQVVIPLAALVILGYTIYRNVIPYPPPGAPRWFPIVSGGWLLVAVIAVAVAPRTARRLGLALAENEGLAVTEAAAPAPLLEGEAHG